MNNTWKKSQIFILTSLYEGLPNVLIEATFLKLLCISYKCKSGPKEILENGNKYKGKKRGIITSDSGVIVEADQFEYDKKINILNASGLSLIHI